MDPSSRMLKLLSLLQARTHWSGHELAARLGVTDRTLRRDVTRLRDLGYPVEALSGPAGGYEMVAGGALPPLLLDDDEAVVVALGLRSAASGGLPGFEDTAIAALAKIEQVLPLRLRHEITALHDSTVRLQWSDGVVEPVDPELLTAVARGCRRVERLRFSYVDASGRASERHVEPFQLVHSSRRWYLVGRDRDRDAWRTFRVDRMRSLVLTGMTFERIDPPDAAALVAEGTAVAVYRWQARVVLDVTPEIAAGFVSPLTGRLEATPEGTVLRIGADELDWIARYLAGLPCRFSVVEPEELRQCMRDLAERIVGGEDGT